MGGKARGHRVGPAEFLRASRGLPVIQVRIVAAAPDDEALAEFLHTTFWREAAPPDPAEAE